MDSKQKKDMLDVSWQLHAQVESGYLAHPARKGDPEWLEKQRLLLADMALHLLQTSIKPEPISLDKLRNNLHSIMTIADQFLPHAHLKQATDNIWSDITEQSDKD